MIDPPCHHFLQALNTLTQENADYEMVAEDPQAIRYPDRAPCEDKCLALHVGNVTVTFADFTDWHQCFDYIILFCHISTVQSKHMFVNRPGTYRTVLINASLVDVSHTSACIHKRSLL